MSITRLLCSEEIVSDDQVYQLVEELGGSVHRYPRQTQGVIGDGEGVIWVEPTHNLAWYQEALAVIKEKYDMEISSIVRVMIATADFPHSSCCALQFCQRFMERYPRSLIYNDYARGILTSMETQLLHCKADGEWTPDSATP